MLKNNGSLLPEKMLPSIIYSFLKIYTVHLFFQNKTSSDKDIPEQKKV